MRTFTGISSQKEALFEIDVLPAELGKFMADLRMVMDIGAVIELNILMDWPERQETKAAIKKRLAVIEDLGLRLSCEKDGSERG